MQQYIKSAMSFVKWRLVPIRYLGRLRYMSFRTLGSSNPPKTALAQKIDTVGYATGPVLTKHQLEAFHSTFLTRAPDAAPEVLKAPFVNLSSVDDLTEDNPLIQFAFSKEVLDVAIDYFGGRLTLDSLQILHSFPQDGALKESQKWHLDYADSRSLHCVVYLNDVNETEDGPFVFINKEQSKKVGRGLIVRRIEDGRFEIESEGVKPTIVYGKAGTSVWVDPAVCYHFGSRCKHPRTAIFVTFNSDKPFTAPVSMIKENAKKIAELGKKMRPDLDPSIFDRMMHLRAQSDQWALQN